MAIFESRTCVAFTWDGLGTVRAVRLHREGDGRLRVLSAVAAAEGAFVENLAAVHQSIQPAEGELVLAGGNLSGAICFEHDFPRMGSADLQEAILYEMPRQAPLAAEELLCSWRSLPGADNQRMRIRILALQRKDWDQLLGDLAAAKLRVDAVMSPWLVIDPLLGAEDAVRLPGMDEGFVLRRDPEAAGLRRMFLDAAASAPATEATAAAIGIETTSLPGAFRDADGAHWLTAALLAAYGVGPNWHRDRPGLLPLPTDLQPVRFQLHRTIFSVLMTLAALLTLVFVVRLAVEARREHRALVRERQATLRQIQEFDARNRAMEPVDTVIQGLAAVDIGVGDMLFCLHHFTTRIPKDMSLTQLNSRGNNFEMNLRTVSDKDDKLSGLEIGNWFKTRNLQKRRNTDGSVNIFLKLNYTPPWRQEKSDVAADQG
jgi:Tfp pilus assembly protein PilN